MRNDEPPCGHEWRTITDGSGNYWVECRWCCQRFQSTAPDDGVLVHRATLPEAPMADDLIARLREAGVPSAAAGNVLIGRFCVGQTLTVAADRMGQLASGVEAAIATDRRAILRVLLAERLEEMTMGDFDRMGTISDEIWDARMDRESVRPWAAALLTLLCGGDDDGV